MAKSLRAKREKRLRALRRELVQPFYDAKEAAKLAAQQAALGAPKLPLSEPSTITTSDAPASMDVEMADGTSVTAQNLKPVGGVGKKMRKDKMKKNKRRGKGKLKRKFKV